MKKLCFMMHCVLVLVSIDTHAALGRDPTSPPTVTRSANADSGNGLQSIIIGNARPRALINDKFVTIGDTVDNMKVLSITPNAVILESTAKKHITLYLFDTIDHSIQE
jgi:hypothetical protein